MTGSGGGITVQTDGFVRFVSFAGARFVRFVVLSRDSDFDIFFEAVAKIS